MEIIDIQSIGKSYGKVEAVRDVSFTVAKGEIFGLLGPNGAGKTTILHILEGILKPDSGRVSLFGMSYEKDRTTILRKLGIQLQSTAFIPELKIAEQVTAFAALFGMKKNCRQAVECLEKVGLAEKAETYPEKLSGGQQQRLSLAIALLNGPDLLILDEPTNGLDPRARMTLWEILIGLRGEGTTIILTTHNMAEAETYCGRVGIIDRGVLLAVDTPRVFIEKSKKKSLITVSSGLNGFDIMKGCSGVHAADFDGRELQILSSDVVATISDLFIVAGRTNTFLGNLHIKRPGLEDVFLDLTGRSFDA